jgi:hypothetical protein
MENSDKPKAAPVKQSPRQSTQAPQVSSGDKGFDAFVKEALQSVIKPKKQ